MMNQKLIGKLADCIRRGCVIVGVGNTCRGDDGFGPALIAKLKGRTSLPLIDAGEVPENFLVPISKTGMPVVVFADALLLDDLCGSLHLIRAEQLDDGGASTHTGSLQLSASFLQQTTGAEVYVLGVVPKEMKFGGEVTKTVRQAVEIAAAAIAELSPLRAESG